ncbi:MAG: universal stress protein [Thermoguttaceae bacterium]
MFHSILVPLDGSQFAEQALPLALKIANRAAASLEVVQVYDRYVIQDPRCGWLPFDLEEDAIFEEKVQAYLDTITMRLEKAASVPVTSALVGGLIADGILERARTKPADLIVMTTHGRGPASRFWLGSVADELVRHASVPIVLVRPQEASADPGPEPNLRRILVPLDGSELAERVLEPAIALGSLMDAKYTFIRAVEPGWFPEGHPHLEEVKGELKVVEQPRLEKRKAEAQVYLDGLAERLLAEARHIKTQVVVGESAATAVLDAVCRQDIDLIAIATHGRGNVKRLLLGSVADKIVRGTFVPVLVYRPAPG